MLDQLRTIAEGSALDLPWDVLTLDPATPEDRRGRPAVRGHTVSGPVIYARPRSVQP